MPKQRGEAAFAVDEGNPEEARPRHAADAGIAVGQVDPVDQHQADDLAEGERDDREVVAAQPQHREPEQDAPERGEHAGDRQQHPERPRPELVEIDGEERIFRHEGDERQAVLGEQRERIGADRVEGDVAEVEQAGEADHDIEAPAEHHVDQDLDAEIVDPFDRALGAEEPEHHQRIGEQESERAHAQAEADLVPALAAGFRRRRVAGPDPGHRGADCRIRPCRCRTDRRGRARRRSRFRTRPWRRSAEADRHPEGAGGGGELERRPEKYPRIAA